MRSRRSGTDWAWLRWLIESNLRRQPEFKKFRLGRRLETLGQGLFNRNYLFETSGQSLVLRLAKFEHELRTKKEAIIRLRQEAKSLLVLDRVGFPYDIPRFVCFVEDESDGIVGLIETAVQGASLELFSNVNEPDRLLKVIAKIAVAVHQLPKVEFGHLKERKESRDHLLEQLKELAPETLKFEQAARAREWLLSHLPENRPPVVLHGDLLPQNVLFYDFENPRFSVVDWQEAQIGDPAYDLAIVTRGARQPLGVARGLERLVESYNENAGQELTASAVIAHELCFQLGWLDDSVRNYKRLGGHAPEHYAAQLGALLRRVADKK
ncbi:MAG TPA: aminoglycoside phosphotransferase family protein [Chthoniobacterales bacterium]